MEREGLMRKLQAVIVMALVVGLTSIVWAGQGPGSGVKALTGQDHAEILRLYGMYNQGSDFRDAELFVSAFSDDAVFTTGPGQEVVGRAALLAQRAERHQGETGDTGRRHYNSSIVITPTPDGAKGRAYWIVMDVSGDRPATTASGYYDDVFMKTPAGWKIKVRTLHRP
jgi:hypothetical protein